jgi:protein-ribulosamine 3-kinase
VSGGAGLGQALEEALDDALGDALGSPVVRSNGLSGGDINQAAQIALRDGRELFVKSNAGAPPGIFAAEARGLAWLAEARALRVPEVVAVSAPDADVQFLVLELIRPAARAGGAGASFEQTLGQGLAALHRFGAPGFGLDHDNFIGRLAQDNRPLAAGAANWADFYRARRLEPQLRMAADHGLASAAMRSGFQRLFNSLASLVGSAEPPSRLHGDLWGGNLMADEQGQPCLIDPAVYGGSREIDLAMMRLFGGFGTQVFAAYRQAWPLGPGGAERVDLYQLYPLMVHVNLFGGGYVGSVEAALSRIL